MFKKMTKVVFIIAMLIQLVPTNIFANEEQKNFISNYIELKTEGEATGVYAQDALDIPEASYKLNVTVNVDGETKEASTLAYDLSTNPEQVSVMALDGYTVASTKLDNIDYHQEIIAFDHENNITSKELVINVTSNPKSELPQEFQSPMINRSAFGIFDQTAYFYLLKPGKDFNSDRGNESYLYVGDGRVNNSGIRVTDAPSNREIKKTMDELAKNIENVVSVTFNGWNRIAKADGAVDKNGNIIASGRQYHVDGTFNVVTRKQVTVNFKVMNPENLDISQDLGINSYLTDKNNEIVMPMSDAAKNYEYNGEKYDFDGWYTDASYTNKVQSDKYQIGEESMTFYAKYVKADTKFNYTINFYKDDKLVEGDTISAYEIAWNHQEKLNVNIEQYKNKYVGYNFDRNDPIETNQIVKNGVIKIYYVKDATKWTTVTFNNGTKGSLRGQDANGNVIFKDILKGTTLAANNINAPEITPNKNCEVAETPWNNGYAADKVIDQETTFTAQYKKNINFTVYLNDDFLSSDDHWVHLDKDMTGHTDNLVYTEDQIKGFANEYITKKKYAKDTYKLVFTTKIEYLDNNTKKWKNYDPELNKVLNEGFEVRYHVYIVKKLDVKFDLNNNEEDVNYKVYNGSKLSDKQSVPTPSKTGYTFIGWKMDDKADFYTKKQIEALNFKDNTTFKAQYVKDEAQRKEMSYQVQYFKDGKLVDDQTVTKTVWINDTKVALDKIDVANDKFKGYVFKETNPKNLPDAVENNAIIKVYYVKDEAQRKEMSYQVQYFKDGKLVDDQKVTKTVWINDTKVALDKIDVANDKFKGYVFKETNPKSLPDAVENNAIIKVYYVKDETQRKEISYQVQYFKDGKLVDKETQTVTKKVWVNDTKVALDKIDVANDKFKGYVFKETNPKNLPDAVEDNAIIKVHYVKDETQRKNLELRIHYYKDNVLFEKELKEYSTWVGNDTAKVNPAIVLDNEKYVGYKLDKDATKEAPTSIKAQSDYYVYYVKDEKQTKDALLTVNYFIDNKKVEKDSYTHKFTMWINDADKAINPAIDAKDNKYVGYDLDTKATGTIPTKISTDTEVNVYYVKDATKWTTVTFNKGTHGTLANEDVNGNVISIEVLIGSKLSDNEITAPRITPDQGWIVARENWDNGYTVDKEVVKDMTFTAQYAEDKNINEIPDIEEYLSVVFEQGTNGTFTEGTQTKFENLLSGFDKLPTAPTPIVNEGYEFTGYTPVLPTYVEGTPKSTVTYVAQYAKVVTPIIPTPENPVTPNTPVTPVTPILPTTPVTPLNPTPVLNPEVVPNEVTPEAKPKPETVKDDKTPLANHEGCWIHWLMLLLTFIYGIYAAVRIYGRGHTNHKNKKEVNEMNKEMEGQAI